MDVDYYRDLTRYQFEGRKLILSGAPLAAFTSAIETFKDLGAADFFILASGVGSGDLPSPEDARWFVMDTASNSMIDSFRTMERILRDPPPEIVRELDSWDPDRRAVLHAGPFFYQDSIAGRAAYGWRRPEWLALEDKVIVDEIWDLAGVERARSKVVPIDQDTIQSTIPLFDEGAGVVLAGDARDGFNGGAEYIRWINAFDDLSEPINFFGAHCDRVRIMPFLEGIPCSIHGFVFPETVVALRPCELMTLRRSDKTLKYCGAASYWDPDDGDRQVMQSVARRVGEHLRRRVGYRGAFTVDGVMTAAGFLPTELNTRAGAGVGTLLAGLPGLSIGSINRALIENEPLDYRPNSFEQMIVDSADERRGGGGWTVVDKKAEKTDSVLLAEAQEKFLKVSDDVESVASLSFGPGDQGGFVRFTPDAGQTPAGPSAAPLVVSAFAVADQLWDVGLGDLTPAPSVR